jgi:hypothetical protein
MRLPRHPQRRCWQRRSLRALRRGSHTRPAILQLAATGLPGWQTAGQQHLQLRPLRARAQKADLQHRRRRCSRPCRCPFAPKVRTRRETMTLPQPQRVARAPRLAATEASGATRLTAAPPAARLHCTQTQPRATATVAAAARSLSQLPPRMASCMAQTKTRLLSLETMAPRISRP